MSEAATQPVHICDFDGVPLYLHVSTGTSTEIQVVNPNANNFGASNFPQFQRSLDIFPRGEKVLQGGLWYGFENSDVYLAPSATEMGDVMASVYPQRRRMFAQVVATSEPELPTLKALYDSEFGVLQHITLPLNGFGEKILLFPGQHTVQAQYFVTNEEEYSDLIIVSNHAILFETSVGVAEIEANLQEAESCIKIEMDKGAKKSVMQIPRYLSMKLAYVLTHVDSNAWAMRPLIDNLGKFTVKQTMNS